MEILITEVFQSGNRFAAEIRIYGYPKHHLLYLVRQDDIVDCSRTSPCDECCPSRIHPKNHTEADGHNASRHEHILKPVFLFVVIYRTSACRITIKTVFIFPSVRRMWIRFVGNDGADSYVIAGSMRTSSNHWFGIGNTVKADCARYFFKVHEEPFFAGRILALPYIIGKINYLSLTKSTQLYLRLFFSSK